MPANDIFSCDTNISVVITRIQLFLESNLRNSNKQLSFALRPKIPFCDVLANLKRKTIKAMPISVQIDGRRIPMSLPLQTTVWLHESGDTVLTYKLRLNFIPMHQHLFNWTSMRLFSCFPTHKIAFYSVLFLFSEVITNKYALKTDRERTHVVLLPRHCDSIALNAMYLHLRSSLNLNARSPSSYVLIVSLASSRAHSLCALHFSPEYILFVYFAVIRVICRLTAVSREALLFGSVFSYNNHFRNEKGHCPANINRRATFSSVRSSSNYSITQRLRRTDKYLIAITHCITTKNKIVLNSLSPLYLRLSYIATCASFMCSLNGISK